MQHGSVLPAVSRLVEVHGLLADEVLSYGNRLHAMQSGALDQRWLRIEPNLQPPPWAARTDDMGVLIPKKGVSPLIRFVTFIMLGSLLGLAAAFYSGYNKGYAD